MSLYHATCLKIEGRGVLLQGPAGSGKSDLALRLMQTGAKFVADDYITLENIEGRLVATPPEKIAGIMEVRGLGLVKTDYEKSTGVALVIDLKARADIPRLPEPDVGEFEGVSIPRLAFHAFDASTPAKILLALRGL